MKTVAADVRFAFSGLFEWWIHELRETRASLAERYTSLRSARFQLQLLEDHAVLARIGDAAGEQQPFKLHENELPPLDQVWPAERPRNARLDLVLPAADALVFQLHMPPMADHELKEAVELQLERKLPLPLEQLLVDWEVIQKHPDRSRTVSVAVARRVRLEQWRDRLRAWAWRLGSIRCRDLDGAVRFNLLPLSIPRVSLAFGRREALLAWMAVGWVVCYGLVTVGQWTYERRSLATKIEEAHTQLAGMRELRLALEQERKPLMAMLELARAPAAGSALAALSATLPTDAWVYQAEIHATAPAPTVMTLEAHAPSATMLVQMLEQAQLFESIQLVESSAAEAGFSRIKIQARLHRGALP